jgi:hypothetical protein
MYHKQETFAYLSGSYVFKISLTYIVNKMEPSWQKIYMENEITLTGYK